MTFRKIKNSFVYAWAGIKFFLKERNIKIHISVALLVLICGFIFKISNHEWIGIVFAITLVLSLEIVNTVIEEFIDLAHPEKNDKIMVIKDLAAAAVLVAALGSIVIGFIIFADKIIALLQ